MPVAVCAIALPLCALALAGATVAAAAAALPCDSRTAAECIISSLVDVGPGGSYEVDRDLRITGTGELRTDPGSTLSITVNGALRMNVGARITGNTTDPGQAGAAISITTSGDIRLNGVGTSGAVISSRQLNGTCTGHNAGDITLVSTGGDITAEHGSRITTFGVSGVNWNGGYGDVSPAGELVPAKYRGSLVVMQHNGITSGADGQYD